MDQRLKEILDKTLQIFQTYGIRSVSMDDICKELKISKKTLYQYVDNKHELIEKVFRYQSSQNDISMLQIVNGNRNAIDVLLDISEWMHTEIKKINPKLSFDLNKYYPELFHTIFNEKREFIYKKVKHNIEQGINEGLYRKDLNVDLVASLYVKKIEDLHEPEGFLCSEDISFKTLFDVMFDNHIRGIANENGLKYYEENIKSIKLRD
jgi:AcrR family transcriptional regulator